MLLVFFISIFLNISRSSHEAAADHDQLNDDNEQHFNQSMMRVSHIQFKNGLPVSSGSVNDGLKSWASKRCPPELVQYKRILGMNNSRGKQMVLAAVSKNLPNHNYD